MGVIIFASPISFSLKKTIKMWQIKLVFLHLACPQVHWNSIFLIPVSEMPLIQPKMLDQGSASIRVYALIRYHPAVPSRVLIQIAVALLFYTVTVLFKNVNVFYFNELWPHYNSLNMNCYLIIDLFICVIFSYDWLSN